MNKCILAHVMLVGQIGVGFLFNNKINCNSTKPHGMYSYPNPYINHLITVINSLYTYCVMSCFLINSSSLDWMRADLSFRDVYSDCLIAMNESNEVADTDTVVFWHIGHIE